MKERRASQKLSSKSIMDPNQNVKCKIVVVGDSQCGKTALLHVFAKDCFPEVSVAGPGFEEGWGTGGPRGIPSLGGFPFAFSLFPYIFKAIFFAPYYFHRLDCLERESGQEAFRGWDTPAHSAVSSETCPGLCAEPGVGRFGSSCLEEPRGGGCGGASGEPGFQEKACLFGV